MRESCERGARNPFAHACSYDSKDAVPAPVAVQALCAQTSQTSEECTLAGTSLATLTALACLSRRSLLTHSPRWGRSARKAVCRRAAVVHSRVAPRGEFATR